MHAAVVRRAVRNDKDCATPVGGLSAYIVNLPYLIHIGVSTAQCALAVFLGNQRLTRDRRKCSRYEAQWCNSSTLWRRRAFRTIMQPLSRTIAYFHLSANGRRNAGVYIALLDSTHIRTRQV